MKRVIQISHRTINTIILLVVIFALIGAGFLLLHRDPALLSQIITRFEGASPTQSTSLSNPDAQAAVKALTAFYTLDYTEPLIQWQSRVCALTTRTAASSSRRFLARRSARWSKPTRSRQAARYRLCAWSKTKAIPASGCWRSPWINPGRVRNPPCRFMQRSPGLMTHGS